MTVNLSQLKRKPILDKAVEMVRSMNRWSEIFIGDTLDIVPEEVLHLVPFVQIVPGDVTYTYKSRGSNVLDWEFLIGIYNSIEYAAWTIGGIEGDQGLVEAQDAFYDLFYDDHTMGGVVDTAQLTANQAPQLTPIATRTGDLAGLWVAPSLVTISIKRGR